MTLPLCYMFKHILFLLLSHSRQLVLLFFLSLLSFDCLCILSILWNCQINEVYSQTVTDICSQRSLSEQMASYRNRPVWPDIKADEIHHPIIIIKKTLKTSSVSSRPAGDIEYHLQPTFPEYFWDKFLVAICFCWVNYTSDILESCVLPAVQISDSN